MKNKNSKDAEKLYAESLSQEYYLNIQLSMKCSESLVFDLPCILLVSNSG